MPDFFSDTRACASRANSYPVRRWQPPGTWTVPPGHTRGARTTARRAEGLQ